MTQPSLFDCLKTDLQIAFDAFDAANPRVYQLFCKFTAEAINAGHRSFGADAIVSRIRWETSVSTRGDEFKINNNFAAAYARKWTAQHPEHEHFFRTRKSAFDQEQAA